MFLFLFDVMGTLQNSANAAISGVEHGICWKPAETHRWVMVESLVFINQLLFSPRVPSSAHAETYPPLQYAA